MRIAQITDLHLRHHQPGSSAANLRRSRLMPELFGQALENIRRQDVDLLAVTGDLLDMPVWLVGPDWGFHLDEAAPWLAWAEADYRLLKRLLNDSGLRYTVLPGNHDVPKVMWRVFNRDENVFDIAGHRIVRFCDEEYECHMPRRFLDQRRRFDAVLNDGASPPQVHLQHYVLTPSLNRGYPHSYDEGEELTRRVVAGKVRLCLSGHYHPGTPLTRQEDTFFAVAPAFSQRSFPWRTYDIDAKGEVTMQDYVLESAPPSPRPVVFLDRDGVINDLPSYQTGPEDMRLLPGAGEAIRRLNEQGYAVVVITNQSAVGAGYVPELIVVAVHDKMQRLLAEQGAVLDGIYFTVGAGDCAVLAGYRDTATCKPSPAMLHRAARELNLTLEGGWMIGDRLSDLRTAVAAEVRPILVRTGDGKQTEAKHGDLPAGLLIVDDLRAAAQLVSNAR